MTFDILLMVVFVCLGCLLGWIAMRYDRRWELTKKGWRRRGSEEPDEEPAEDEEDVG